MKRVPTFVRSAATVQCRIKVSNPIAIERYKDSPQLGRFTLRDEGNFFLEKLFLNPVHVLHRLGIWVFVEFVSLVSVCILNVENRELKTLSA